MQDLSPSLLRSASVHFAAELKFVVSHALAEDIRHWARQHLEADTHGRGPANDVYSIASLYLDTADFRVLQRAGSYGRCKYRIRRYGQSGLAFVERKLKNRGLVSKRRTPISLAELEWLNGVGTERQWSARWFHQRVSLRQLQPVCQVRYSRMARVGSTPAGPVRLTLDDHLTASTADAFCFERWQNPVELLPGCAVLELKYRQMLPVLFKQLMTEFSLTPQTASKYRLGATAFALGSTMMRPADPTAGLCLIS